MLSVEHVTKTYGKFTALEDISLTFTPGVYGLLAPNGAGKTTLIKMLTTLLFPTKGQILWEGEDIQVLGAEYRGLLGHTGPGAADLATGGGVANGCSYRALLPAGRGRDHDVPFGTAPLLPAPDARRRLLCSPLSM